MVNQIETHPFASVTLTMSSCVRHRVQMEAWGGFAEGRNDLFTEPMLSAIGDAHDKSVAQVVLRWLIQRDIIVIPKSVRRDAWSRTSTFSTSRLTDEEMTRIAALELGVPSSSTTATRPWSVG